MSNSHAVIAGWALCLGILPVPTVSAAQGFHRSTLGDFEIIALQDGVIPYPTAQILPGATPEQIRARLAALGLTDPVGMSYNAYLINTGTRVVLIDTGTGGKLSDSPFFRGAGQLIANLRASGYAPEQIDEIYITHLGPDHVGGLSNGAERAFPNAIVRAATREVDLFRHPETAPAWTRSWTAFWAGLFEPYIKAGRFSSFSSDTTLTPGIRSLGTNGHSSGHTSYVVESRGQTLIVLGDLVLMGALQFPEPALSSGFDSDRPAAAEQRIRVLRLAAERDFLIAGAHLDFPGIGRVKSAGQGFHWTPGDSAR